MRMKRRDLLKNAALAGALTLGVTATASAAGHSSVNDVSKVSLLNGQVERVTMSIEEADVDPAACCISEDGCDACPPGCRCCVC